MNTRPFIYIGSQAVDQLIDYLAHHGMRRVTIVADTNTYDVLGARTKEALAVAGIDVHPVILTGPEVIVDEQQVVEVMLHNDAQERTFVAVGSGTITDIVRFVTLQTKSAFISLPTAPSVDGYTSPITPMVIKRLKVNGPGHLPQAVFADLNVLRGAPQSMIAAGVGDIIAKWTSTADWKLGRLVWGDHFDAAIAERFDLALKSIVDAVDEISVASEKGIRTLIQGLIECGFCMTDYGSSFPASGAEHLLSHFWESRLLAERRPALLHGAKVGVGTVLAAGFWQQVRAIDYTDAARRLEESQLPDPEQEIACIRASWPFAVTQVQSAQARFLAMTKVDYESLKTKILIHWDEIQSIAAGVPSPSTVVDVLRKVRGPTTTKEVGLEERDLTDGLEYAYYLRDRFTILRLRRMLDLS
jgi:glycerol-1-phosphate dehydrogenase [NAD(P)+]